MVPSSTHFVLPFVIYVSNSLINGIYKKPYFCYKSHENLYQELKVTSKHAMKTKVV